LSARTESALGILAEELASYLEAHPDLPIASVAQTLALGRRAFKMRRVVVASERGELANALRSSSGTTASPPPSGKPRGVAFVFPGQGTQYPRMAAGLYESEPTFRAFLDECARLLDPVLDVPLLELLYPKTVNAEVSAERLKETRNAQPAIFAVEYALAQLLLSWGIRPAAMVGHSVGEFVAATLAGVFSLDDALRLVVARGRLMQGMPSGAMLSVRVGAAELEARLVPGTSIAAYNGRTHCVAGGPHEAVQRLQARLEADSIPAKLLRTSHAFHTALMEPAVEGFLAELEGVKLNLPAIPFVSTATGTWITEAQAVDPVYWARHLRVPVRFDTAIQELCARGHGILIEAGPAGTLPTLVRPSTEKGVHPIAMMGRAGDAPREQRATMSALGQLFVLGVDVDWRAVWMHAQRRKCSLPLYPFEHQRYWVDPPSLSPAIEPTLPVDAAGANGDERIGPRDAWAPRPDEAGDVEAIVKNQLGVLAQQLELLERIEGGGTS
jgi:acyl transferase domain-containing protein